MKQKYELGKEYWVLHNNQPTKNTLNFVHLKSKSKEEKEITYGFRGLFDTIYLDNTKRLAKFKEDEIFTTLCELAKYYKLK